MTTITIELPDDLAAQARAAGLLNSPVIADLIGFAMGRIDASHRFFEQEVSASVAQADSPDAQWLAHAEVAAEWAAERAALLAGKPFPNSVL